MTILWKKQVLLLTINGRNQSVDYSANVGSRLFCHCYKLITTLLLLVMICNATWCILFNNVLTICIFFENSKGMWVCFSCVLHITRAQSNCSQYSNGSYIIPSLTVASVKAVFRTVFHVQNLLWTAAGQTHSLCSRSGQLLFPWRLIAYMWSFWLPWMKRRENPIT